jgi:4'-phosphopantetheinyl transferase EntD
MAEMGIPEVGIGRGPGGEPVWPSGIVGSISHSGDLAIALVGRRQDYVGLGIDVEQLARGPSLRAARLVCRPIEMDWVLAGSGTERLGMLFSAKEAVFKAVYPINQVWLGFADAELTWLPDHGRFEARLLKAVGAALQAGVVLEVPCSISGGWVVSSAYRLA